MSRAIVPSGLGISTSVRLAVGGVDLRPAALSERQRLSRRVRAWTAALLTWSALVLTLALVLSPGGASTRAALAQLESERADLARLKSDLEARQSQVRTRLMLVERGLDVSRHVARHPDWSILLRTLAVRGSGSVVLENVELERLADTDRVSARRAAKSQDSRPPAVDRYALRVAGLGRSQESVSAYVLALESSGLFERVTIRQTEARRGDSGISGVGFRLEASLAGGVPGVRERGGSR